MDIDSLETEIPKMSSRRAQWDAYLQVSRSKIYSDTEKALDYGQEMLRLAGEIDSDSLRATSYVVLGTAYGRMKRYEGAISAFTQGIRFAQLSQDHATRLIIHFNMGTVYLEMGNLSRGEREMKKAYGLIDEGTPLQIRIGIMNNLAACLQQSGQSAEALEMFQQLEAITPASDLRRHALISMNLSAIYKINGNHKDALAAARKAIDYVQGTELHENLTGAFAYAAHAAQMLGMENDAARYLDSTEYHAALAGTPKAREEYFDAQVSYLENKKRYREALAIYRKYEYFRDSVAIATEEARIGELQAKMDFAEQEARAELYQAEAELARQKGMRQNILVWGLGIGVGVLALAAGFLIFGLVVRSRANSALKIKNEEVQAKNEKIERMMEQLTLNLEEKNVLVQEVNHRVKNNLQMITAFVEIQAQFIEEPETADFAEGIRKRIRAVSLVHEMIVGGKQLARLEFKDYLGALLQEMQQIHFQGEHLEYNCEIAPVKFDLSVNMYLGIMLNELVSNSLKHADQPGETLTISISLHREGDQFVLKYGDSGAGLPEEMRASDWNGRGIGLVLVRTMARQLEGTLTYGPSPEEQYRIEFPLPEGE